MVKQNLSSPEQQVIHACGVAVAVCSPCVKTAMAKRYGVITEKFWKKPVFCCGDQIYICRNSVHVSNFKNLLFSLDFCEGCVFSRNS